MSTPMASLKKSRKNPLPGIGPPTSRKNVPFRVPNYSEDENKLLGEITNKMVDDKRALTSNSGTLWHVDESHIDNEDCSRKSSTTPGKTAPSDKDLLGLMMTRLNHLEQRLQYQTKEMVEKDKKISIMEDKIQIMQKAKGGGADLEKKCLRLQRQVCDMEDFLADYGMVWAGASENSDADVYYNEGLESFTNTPSQEHTVAWGDFELDYDLVIRNVDELNALAGDGKAQIQKTVGGAKLKMIDSISLILYANGILMFDGPFRPMTDLETQECLQDLMDGYFPAELQNRYPEGIPINVTDKRNVHFQDKKSGVFKGSGQMLGGETKPSRLVPSKLGKSSPRYVRNEVQVNKATSVSEREDQSPLLEVESELPGHQLSMDQFLNKLPQSVIKQGRVIDIRNSVSEDLQVSKSTPMNHVSIIETQAVKDMKNRLEIEHDKRPPSAHNVTTLRVKSEKGDHTYILKMKFKDTIGDIRKYLKQHRPEHEENYFIMSAFPKRTFEDDTETLQDCGLIPNAALHLKSCCN